jgi:hypothetical protein
MLARLRGTNHPRTSVPTYVRLDDIAADGPAYLGSAYSPFDAGGPSKRDMVLGVPPKRLGDRRTLLASLDRLREHAEASRALEGMSAFERQAFEIVLSRAPEAFDLKREDPRVVEAYGKGLGQKLLLARRLCEAGCGFVTIHFGGWDMHGNIKSEMEGRSPEMDRAVSAFVEDLRQRGLDHKILLVITGEFGRTPRVNGSAGRDHWAPLSTLAFAGGGLRMGQVVGESSAKVEEPKTRPITPLDLAATVFHVLGLPPEIQFVNNAGRPVTAVESGQPIAELV